jgi:DtxR family Mn-dependent transcriptional regulator
MTVSVHSLPERLADCLKLCYLLRERGEHLTAHAVLACLQAKEPGGPPSGSVVTRAFEQLHTLGYVSYTRYHGVALTEAGETAAAELVRHQRLLELFLFRILGLPLDQVATEAERLEHVLSEALEERIDALLEHPREDPHGDPIPDLQGRVRIAPSVRLSEVPVGQVVQIQRLQSQDAGLMHYLESLGLVPGAVVRLESRTAYGDVFMLRIGETSLPVGTGVAAQVQVRLLHESVP